MTWQKRSRRYETALAQVAAWHTADKAYRIECHRYTLAGMHPCWFAMVANVRYGGFDILSRHRKKAAAIRACEKHCRQRGRTRQRFTS
jgi:hypothetical protein